MCLLVSLSFTFHLLINISSFRFQDSLSSIVDLGSAFGLSSTADLMASGSVI